MSDAPTEFHITVHTCPMCGAEVDEFDRACATCGEGMRRRPLFTMHPLRSVVCAALFGGLASSAIVLGINYSRMGRGAAAFRVIVIGIIVMLATLVVMEFYFSDASVLLFSFLQLWLVYFIGNALQGKEIREHIKQGGPVASAWAGAGIGFLGMIVLFVVVFVVAVVIDIAYGIDPPGFAGTQENHIRFGKDDIYYSGDATEAEARKLAKVLEEEQLFGLDGATVRLNKSNGRYTLTFFYSEGAWDDPILITYFKEFGRRLTKSHFPAPLTINLCDLENNVQRTITAQ